jgi:hypothetical protein
MNLKLFVPSPTAKTTFMKRTKFVILIFATILWIPVLSFGQCDEIEVTKDKFTDVVTKRTPGLIKKEKDKSDLGINIVEKNKMIVLPVTLSYTSDSGKYSLTLMVRGKEGIFSPKGAWLVLADGTKLQYPEAYVMSYPISDIEYYIAATQITKDEVNILGRTAITDIRVDSYECSLSAWLGGKIRSYFECLSK